MKYWTRTKKKIAYNKVVNKFEKNCVFCKIYGKLYLVQLLKRSCSYYGRKLDAGVFKKKTILMFFNAIELRLFLSVLVF